MWVNRKEAGFYLSQQGALPTGTQAISFADINRDGTIDLIFPTCARVTSSGVGMLCDINIAYNQQLPLCTLATESGMRKGVRYCRRPEDLCTADMGFKFNLTDSPDNHVATLFSPANETSTELSCRHSSNIQCNRCSPMRHHFSCKTPLSPRRSPSPSNLVTPIWTGSPICSSSPYLGSTVYRTFCIQCHAAPALQAAWSTRVDAAGMSQIKVSKLSRVYRMLDQSRSWIWMKMCVPSLTRCDWMYLRS